MLLRRTAAFKELANLDGVLTNYDMPRPTPRCLVYVRPLIHPTYLHMPEHIHV